MEHYKNFSLRNIKGEIWKDIPDFEGIYQASNLGRIKSITSDRATTFGNIGKYGKICIMKSYIIKKGYCRISFWKKINNRMNVRGFLVHRLIAKTFIQNPENKRYINHKNGIKTDNRVENLEWVTNQENIDHKMMYLFKSKSKILLKFTKKEIKEIKKMNNLGFSLRKIAKIFNTYHSDIGYVIKNT